MNTEELSAWLRLTRTDGVGLESARRLLACFGSAPAIFGQSEYALRQVVSVRQAAALVVPPADLNACVALTQHWLAQSLTHQLWPLGHSAYPAALLDLPDPPLMLYAQGNATLATTAPTRPPGVAIVGSRNPTHQGAQTARQMAQALASTGLCVVSGLALGIDAAAHEGALEGAPSNTPTPLRTIAVVGTGLDRVYPRQHQSLAHRVAQHGLLLSEYALGTPPLAANFPRRNRLIAALGLGTLVVEAALRSGSLITAQLALDMGREVLAIPGSIHSPQSHGCHALIRQGAKLVESAHDVLEELQLPMQGALPLGHALSQDARQAHTNDLHADDPFATLLTHMGYDPVSLDALQARSGLDTATLQAQLLSLELDGRLGRLPGGLFQRSG